MASPLLPHSTPPFVIIGAGLAGLSCAFHLRRPRLLLEASATVGGVARSVERGGFTFDITGHWLHLRDARMRELVHSLLGSTLQRISRRASIYSHGRLTPYPFQANTYGLPAPVAADCLLGYFAAREKAARGEHPEPTSFEDFIRQRMGDGIARHFMIPYNTKLWTVPPAQMDWRWCERFVPTPSAQEVVYGALLPTGSGQRLGYNATFSYPRAGGIGQLALALAARLDCELHLSTPVEAVDWAGRRVRLGDGRWVAYRRLLSTMPLDDLVAKLIDAPAAIREAGAALRATSVTYWDIGVRGAAPADSPHWVYFAEPEFPFYRVGIPSAVMPSLAPSGHRSLCAEVSHPRGEHAHASREEVLVGLRHAGLLGVEEEPVLLEKSTIDCAYVIMDHHFDMARRRLLDWLNSQSIESFGRYGAWTYDSMEGAMLQGREVAERLEACG